MALDRVKGSNENKHHGEDNFKGRPKRDKSFQTKIIIRRLPPTMTDEQFLEQISPVPDHDYFHFVKGDLRLGQYAFSRAYLNFTILDEICIFKEKFDGYVFLDAKGNEYPAVVEFAPFQKIPKKRSKKRDAKCGTIETDADYLNFLESLKNPEETTTVSAETYLEEIETRDKELRANNGVLKVTTPLIEYLKQRKIEQQKIREEKREERKRRELEKKRLREEERRRRKAEKERKDKLLQKESQAAEKSSVSEDAEETAQTEEVKTDTVVQVLKNPEREKDVKEHTPQKSKDFYNRHNGRDDKGDKEWESDHNRNRESDRHRNKDWDSDRVRNKDRNRNDRVVVNRDKDRSRRMEYKSSHTGSKSSYIENRLLKIKQSAAESTNVPKPVNSKALDEEIEDTSSKDVVEKCITKMKRDKSCPGIVETSSEMGDYKCDKEFSTDEDSRVLEANNESKSEGCLNDDSKDGSKDTRSERRIKNKDRPSLEIYRPGMRRITGPPKGNQQKEVSTSTSNSSSPSPTPSGSSKTPALETTEENTAENPPAQSELIE